MDACSYGAVSMSMNQTRNGTEKIFVVLKSVISNICDWRDVNLGSLEEENTVFVETNKWLNYKTKPDDYIAILNAKIT